MIDDLVEVELFVRPRSIEVWVSKRPMFTLGAIGRRLQLRLHETTLGDVDLVDTFNDLHLALLDTYTLVIEQEEHMALPRVKRAPVADQHFPPITPTRRQGSGTTEAERIAELSRNVVLRDILDSMIDHPDQTPAERAEETRRIARRHSERFFAVAGVRAALTKGIYGGTVDQLIVERRRERRALERKRQTQT